MQQAEPPQNPEKDNNNIHSEESDEDEDYDKPIAPNKIFNSQTQEDTFKEIENFKIKSRPLYLMQFIKKRRDFALSCKLNETEAQEKTQDIKQSQTADPFGHQKFKVIDIGLQACNPITSTATQTTWHRKINKACKTEDKQPQQNFDEEDKYQELHKFLENVYPVIEEGLQSNETIDIYQDDFKMIAGDEIRQEGTELSTNIKELKSFNFTSCRNKRISCIQFQPQNSTNRCRYLAASFVENLSFDERILYNLKSHKNMIVIWDYEDIHAMDPILILTSPLEITCFAFNPKDQNIVVAGCINGQILYWDLKVSQQFQAYFSGKKGQKKQEKSEIPELPPLLMSCLQDTQTSSNQSSQDVIKKNVSSHKNPVLCMQWIPTGIEVDKKQVHHVINPNHGQQYQFASISCDGQVLIWDTRFFEPKDKGKQQFDIQHYMWRAIYGIQLYRPNGGGQMGGAQLSFRKSQKTPTLVGTSDEGELFIVDWTIRPTEENPNSDLVTKIWQNQRNYRPCVGLDSSVFFEDVELTLHDFNFCIWFHQVDVPIFESMILRDAQITCGAFSPSRPGVILIGRSDGNLDIWDLIDQSHKATIQYQVVAKPLTYIKFHDNLHHTVAIGDIDGFVHIIELPSTFCRKMGEEERTMKQFLAREVARVNYFKNRFKLREETFKKDTEEEEKQKEVKEEKHHKDDEKKEDEDDVKEREYQEFAKAYISEFINKDKPQEVKPEEDKKKKK